MSEFNHKKFHLREDSRKYIWYPFTQMQEYQNEYPTIIEEGNGATIKDIDGNEYIDGVSSLWANVHGHKKQRIDEAIKAQLDKIAHTTLLGLSNVPAIELARKLAEITPEGLTRVFYSDNGATAVEAALKIAYQYQQQSPNGNPAKKKFMSLKNAYHGDTIGSVSVGGMDIFHNIFGGLLFHSYKAESPYCYRCPFNKTKKSCSMECLDDMESIMIKHSGEIAALIMEPLVQGAAGIIVHPHDFLKRTKELCVKYNILMIIDEVATGFGKTGKMFACEHEEVVPDIIALAKGLSGGYLPLAATVTTEEIYNAFLGNYEEYKTFFHGHTYTGNPLACAAAAANLEIFEDEDVLASLQHKIKRFEENLRHFSYLKHVGDIRQVGIMAGIEIVKNKDTKEAFLPVQRIGARIILEARNHGLMIRPLGDVIVLMPPLSVTSQQLNRLCEITYDSIEKITAE